MKARWRRLRIFNVQTIPVRPPLKWAGGKRWLVPHLVELWKVHQGRRLVEPFCGGLAVALSMRPKRALLNDINPHAVHFYSWLKRGLKVNDRLEFDNREALFYEHRSRFNQLISNGGAKSAEAAALFYYLNRTCYNGLCRFNSSGQFNVPFGRYKRINYKRDFSSYRSILGNWQFSTGDFEQVSVEPDDFVYADPPYDVEFRSYSKGGLQLGRPGSVGGVVVKASGADRPVESGHRSDSATVRKARVQAPLIDAPRMINCTGDRSPAKEVLATRGLD